MFGLDATICLSNDLLLEVNLLMEILSDTKEYNIQQQDSKFRKYFTRIWYLEAAYNLLSQAQKDSNYLVSLRFEDYNTHASTDDHCFKKFSVMIEKNGH